jgi:hypothetical protein
MNTLSQVSKALQSVLTIQADQLARRCGVVQRRRKLSGASLAQALVLGWLHRPNATLEQLTQVAAVCGEPIRPQSLDRRFRAPTAEFFEQLLKVAVAQVVSAEPVSIELLKRFAGVWLEDSTVIQFPRCFAQDGSAGGVSQGGAAGLKLFIELDLASGRLLGPVLAAARQSDHTSRLADAMPSGSVRVADLGFFDLAKLSGLGNRGVFWITRIQPHTAIYDQQGNRLWIQRLMGRAKGPLDQNVQLGLRERVACRLIVRRAPASVVRRRRQRLVKEAVRRGRVVSQRQYDWCRWTVVATNIPSERLSVQEALVLLKMRWQIELLFKRWKSSGRLSESRSANPWRILVEIYAKLLGMIIQHWLLLMTSWQYEDRSLMKADVAIQDHVLMLAEPLAAGRRLIITLQHLTNLIRNVGRLQSPRCRPPSYCYLQNPSLIDSMLN